MATRFDPINPPVVKDIRICCISDTHTEAQNIPGGIPQCDIVIHAGDITYRGELDKIARFDEWGGRIPLPTEQKICIAGNHDLSFETDPEVAEANLTQWTYLNDSSTEVMGLKIYGSPWSPSFYPEEWAFNQNRGKAAAERWAKIPDDVDVLIVHGPPFGYGDRTRGLHVGCVDLMDRLHTVRPMLTVCGHIHEDYGVFLAPWGTVVNACSMTEGYKPKRKPLIVNIPVIVR